MSFVCLMPLKMPPLSKTCPKCGANMNVRKNVCDCGDCFVLKRKVSVNTARKSVRIAMRNKRTLDTIDETTYRQGQNQVSMAKKRTLEHPSEITCRQEQNRANIAKKRALESPSEILCSQEQARVRMTKKKESIRKPGGNYIQTRAKSWLKREH